MNLGFSGARGMKTFEEQNFYTAILYVQTRKKNMNKES